MHGSLNYFHSYEVNYINCWGGRHDKFVALHTYFTIPDCLKPFCRCLSIGSYILTAFFSDKEQNIVDIAISAATASKADSTISNQILVLQIAKNHQL